MVVPDVESHITTKHLYFVKKTCDLFRFGFAHLSHTAITLFPNLGLITLLRLIGVVLTATQVRVSIEKLHTVQFLVIYYR